MSLPFAAEKQVAVAAVRRACALTSSVFNKLVNNETLIKGDKSPVTIGDYSAQAVINTILSNAFPDDPIVGEEDAADLRDEAASGLCQRVQELSNEALMADLGIGEVEEWGLGPVRGQRTKKQLLDAIDRGTYAGGRSGRMWTLDPIDGTKGFLRGEQYAVCLSLIIDSQVQLGVIGCPNLPQTPSNPSGPKGCLFVAVRNQGAHQLKLSGTDPLLLQIPPFSTPDLQTLESVEPAHSSHGFNNRVAQILQITKPPIRMDSQAKYCALARGDGGFYLRMPTGVGYHEKIWDHAPGSLLIQEAGGIVSDSRGEPLDFGKGRTLGENFGVVAAGKSVHSKVLAAIRQVQEEAKVKI